MNSASEAAAANMKYPPLLSVAISNLLLVLSVAQVILHGGCLPQREEPQPNAADPGEPLFLTPYIERGDIAEARRLARVELNDSLHIESYAGFFTVNKDYGSNQFLWYFPSMSPDKEKAPVVLWLQGGPGASSLFGLFVENGPISVENDQFQRRQYHWALNHHLIYIDNPVGAGFSFTQREQGYCTNETQVGEQLYSTVTQFFQLFPELQQNEFFITGESYAGKYVPALAHTILKKNSTGKSKVNLKGLVIGGAWINPDSQKKYRYADICNDSQYEKNIIHCYEQEDDDTRNNPESQRNIYGDEINFDYDQTFNENDLPNNDYIAVLSKSAVRKAIHVGNLLYTDFNDTVFHYLLEDFCRSMAPWLSELLDYYPVTIYGGENDTTVHYAGIVDFLRNHFNFTGVEEYREAKQYGWRVDEQWAGCVRRARLLTDVFVLNATHLVPEDQPRRAWDMITRITRGQGFEQNEPCPTPS